MYRQREPNFKVTTTLKPYLYHTVMPDVKRKMTKWSELLESGVKNYVRKKRGLKDIAEIERKLKEQYKATAHLNARVNKKLLAEINILRFELKKPQLPEKVLDRFYMEEEKDVNFSEKN